MEAVRPAGAVRHFTGELTAQVGISEYSNCKTWYENERVCGMMNSMPQIRSFSYPFLLPPSPYPPPASYVVLCARRSLQHIRGAWPACPPRRRAARDSVAPCAPRVLRSALSSGFITNVSASLKSPPAHGNAENAPRRDDISLKKKTLTITFVRIFTRSHV